MKICPILKAGTMLTGLGTHSQQYPIKNDVQFSASARHDLPECIGKFCAWFGHGCPAYPDYLSTKEAKSETE